MLTKLNCFVCLQGPQYVIHVICGANESVADRNGPELSRINWPRSHNKFHYSHINFLASPTGPSAVGVLPTLFFAECVNHNEESDRARKNNCYPVVVPPTNVGVSLIRLLVLLV